MAGECEALMSIEKTPYLKHCLKIPKKLTCPKDKKKSSGTGMRRSLLENQSVTVSSWCFQWNIRDDIAFLSDAA